MRKYGVWILLFLLFTVRFWTISRRYKDGQRIRVSSRISSEPVYYDDSQSIKMQNFSFYLPRYPEVSLGDKIVVEGVVEKRKLKEPVLLELSKSEKALPKIRKSMISFFDKSLPVPHSTLIAGMVLGSKSGFSEEFWEALKSTGTVHVVVASGMNVTLVGGFLMKILVTYLKRGRAVIFAIIGIWIYTFLSGFEAPLIRAAVMGSVAFSAQEFGRLYYSARALLLTGLVMLILNPLYIVDLSFILSFVATGSLMLFEGKVNRLIYFVPSVFREGLSTSLAAQIGVAPILYFAFGQFNILSPFINALILWTVPPVTVIGFVAGFVGLLVPFLGRIILLAAYPLTSWFTFVVKLFS